MDELEICRICKEETGFAGKGEDSLYDMENDGPYCERCYECLPEWVKINEG